MATDDIIRNNGVQFTRNHQALDRSRGVRTRRVTGAKTYAQLVDKTIATTESITVDGMVIPIHTSSAVRFTTAGDAWVVDTFEQRDKSGVEYYQTRPRWMMVPWQTTPYPQFRGDDSKVADIDYDFEVQTESNPLSVTNLRDVLYYELTTTNDADSNPIDNTNVQDMIGTTNKNNYIIAGAATFDKYQLVFAPPSIDVFSDGDGNLKWRTTYTFLLRMDGWFRQYGRIQAKKGDKPFVNVLMYPRVTWKTIP
jgi:hypothetical protein